MRILILENSKFTSTALKEHFLERDKNIKIYQAFSLKESKNILNTKEIDFIISNLILADGENEYLIRQLKSYSEAKIMVLTSEDRDSKREKLFKLGVLDYFSKTNPLNFVVNEVMKVIEQYLRNENITILVVDDSKLVVGYVKNIFENRNYKVLRALNGEEALDILNHNHTDIMILDLDMPILSGSSVIKKVRKNDNFLDLPIIVLSAITNKDVISDALKNGANEYILKPFSVETLILKTEMFISMSYNQRELQAQKDKITDSIKFASIIQNSILPNQNSINRTLKDNFIIWEPKDIVGGDIYQFEKVTNGFLIIIIDCIGHGVAGAFMTMVTKTALNTIINSENYNNPALILQKLNKKIKTTLNQDKEYSVSNAGLDGGILYIDELNKKARFASAKTTLFYVQNDKLNTIKGDRISIGYKDSDINFEFNNYEVDIINDTYFYISTDGLIDQNGGRKGLPFGKKRVQELLNKNYKFSFKEQKEKILSELINYQNREERNDDLTMIGFKLSASQ